MNKKILGIVVALVIAGGSFYGGMSYAKGKVSTAMRSGNFTGQFGAGVAGANRTGRTGSFTAGQILSKDATSITIKMQDGSTKIVLVGPSTQIMKTTAGSQSDFAVGAEVTVSGSANSDGSMTAQSVQIRPASTTSTGR